MTGNVLQKVVAWYIDFFSNLWHDSVLHLFSSLSDFSWLQQSSGYTLHVANFAEGELPFFFVFLGHDEKKLLICLWNCIKPAPSDFLSAHPVVIKVLLKWSCYFKLKRRVDVSDTHPAVDVEEQYCQTLCRDFIAEVDIIYCLRKRKQQNIILKVSQFIYSWTLHRPPRSEAMFYVS